MINDEGIYNEIERLGVNNAVIEYNLDESNPQSVIIQEEDKVKNTTNVEKYLEAKEPEMQVKNTFDIFGTKTPKQQSTESVNKKLSLFDIREINLATGIPVHLDIILAISSSVTLLRSKLSSALFSFSAFSSSIFNCFCNSGNLPYFNSAALFNS